MPSLVVLISSIEALFADTNLENMLEVKGRYQRSQPSAEEDLSEPEVPEVSRPDSYQE